ncbi:MAG TPA: type II toxin-antitoxin system death-on-curing family toxin [Pyrinomonadaceae bacterium]|nr:type II toxin-antitoxin system death-on-curing family toxin [Pyrinomonadaceae bacterium]
MRYLSLEEVVSLHAKLLARSGGGAGLRDSGALESAVAQPEMSFGGEDLYPTVVEKAAALGHSLIQNHPFIDGNKRVGHAAMEVFLVLNGYEIDAPVDEQESVVLAVASSRMSRAELGEWLKQHVAEASV